MLIICYSTQIKGQGNHIIFATLGDVNQNIFGRPNVAGTYNFYEGSM